MTALGPDDIDLESLFGAHVAFFRTAFRRSLGAAQCSLAQYAAVGTRGVRWLHTGGIHTLLSDKAAALCKEALIVAGKHG
jgi:hypothetical protein